MLRPGGRLIVPTFCHDETRLSWIVSRLMALTGFPGRRRFTVSSLARGLEQNGLRIERTESLPGLIPIGYIEGVFGESYQDAGESTMPNVITMHGTEAEQ